MSVEFAQHGAPFVFPSCTCDKPMKQKASTGMALVAFCGTCGHATLVIQDTAEKLLQLLTDHVEAEARAAS